MTFSLKAEEPLDVVKLRYAAPSLLVEVRVNGSEPLPFAFDTGSTTSLIDARVARRLVIETSRRRGAGGPGFARARTLAVGRAEAHDLELVIRDLSPLAGQLGEPVAGILGFNWMEQFVFEITYPEVNGRGGALRLWPRTVELTPTADQLPLPLELYSVPRFSGASLYVSGRLEGARPCKFQLDTGAATGVLGRQIAQRLGVDVSRAGKGHQAERDFSGFVLHQVGRLELAGRLFANVTFRVDTRRGVDGNPYGQCLIGNEQLREFVLTIDIPRRRAFFRRHPSR